jgi:hypothetical protein
MFANLLGTQLPVVLLQSRGAFSLEDLIALLPLLFVLYLITRFIGKVTEPTVIDHKYQLFEFTQLSALDFYTKIENILNDLRVPELKWFRVTYSESGGILSARREYLRVMYKGLGYTICGAPFGTSFFISWREDEPSKTGQQVVGSIPHAGKYFAATLSLLFQKTRYREDTELMYRETVQGIMTHLVTVIGKDKGVRGPAELEHKPLYVRPSLTDEN